MDSQTIKKMLEDSPVIKTPRQLKCECGAVVKVSRYQGKEPYKCHNCRYPKTQKS